MTSVEQLRADIRQILTETCRGEINAAVAGIMEHAEASLTSLKEERDRLIAAIGEHVTVRGEYYARAQAAEQALSALRQEVVEKVGPFVADHQKWTSHDDYKRITAALSALYDKVREGLVVPELPGGDPRSALATGLNDVPSTAEMMKAGAAMLADFQTSEHHHPHHVLVPLEAFEAMRAALSKAGVR